ncbi:hypothetical protein M8A51_25605 [Schlegelella sp. S2-27]|uniref:Uncharacterized protein n=1 Tax=Caldimonas mangrovi TaxID=2944811 RepID=A0ABT0YVY2_9BURK|nr:hypothetical protein [Caldimonas mangrovi]MCM5682913.1 hypothetical protein [Caldimonas mangrovi]
MSHNFGRDSSDRGIRKAHAILDAVRAGRRQSGDYVEWALSRLGDLGREVSRPASLDFRVGRKRSDRGRK